MKGLPVQKWMGRGFLGIVLVSGLVGCRPKISALPIDPTPRVAVVSAFDAEQELLLAKTQKKQAQVLNGRTYTTGVLGGKEVVLVASGISMVNAAMTTQTLLDSFEVRAVVFSGIAGGVNPDLNIGDVTVPARWGQYQEQTFVRSTGDGWDIPANTPFGSYGMMVPGPVDVVREGGRPDQEVPMFWFAVDEDLLETARQVEESILLEDCPTVGTCLEEQPKIVVGGNGVSGPTFVDNAEYRDWVWQTFQADALDMESAAVAHVAYTNDTPFIAFRSLSDLAGGGPGENELASFFLLAANNSATVVIKFLEFLE